MAGEKIINEVTTRVKNEGIAQATSEAKNLDRALDGVAIASDNTAKATIRSEAALNRLLMQIDPTYAATQRLADGQRTLALAQNRGKISAEEQALRLTQLQARFGGVAAANAAAGKAAGVSAAQYQQLGFQVNDVFTQLASGGSVFQTLAQQSGQIYQALGAGPGGVGGALKEIGGRFLGLLTPARLAFGGIAAAAITAGLAYNDFLDRQKALEVSLKGMGQAAGATVSQMTAIAEAAANASGLSVAATTEITTALLNTGKIGKDAIGGIAALTKDFAATVGADIPEATKMLAAAFADPAKGAATLAEKVTFLDGRTLAHIQTLQAMGDRTGAANALTEALSGGLIKASETMTVFGRSWEFVSTSMSSGMSAIGNAIEGLVDPSLTQQIERLVEARARMAEMPQTDQRGAAIAQLEREIELLNQQVAAENQLAQARADSAKARADSLAADKIVGDLNPAIEQYRVLTEQVVTLQRALASPENLKSAEATRAALGAITAAANDYARAGGALALQQGKLIAQGRLQIAAINATTVAQRAEIAAQQMAVSLLGKQISETERFIMVEQARAQVIAQATAAMNQSIMQQEQQIEVLELQISSMGMSASARDVLIAGMQAEHELINRGIDLGSEQAQTYIKNAEAIAELSAKYNELKSSTNNATVAQRKYNTALQERTYLTSSGMSTTNRSEAERSAATEAEFDRATGGGGGGQFQMYGQQVYSDWMKQFQGGKGMKGADTQAQIDAALAEAEEAANARRESQAAGTESSNATAAKAFDLSKVNDPISRMIERLMDQQNSIMDRAFKPDPYAERNADYFYNGAQIFKAGQDKQFDGVQTQINSLRDIQATLSRHPSAIGQSVVEALRAAGFGDLAAQIAAVIVDEKKAVAASSGSGSTSSAIPSTLATADAEFKSGMQKFAEFAAKQLPGVPDRSPLGTLGQPVRFPGFAAGGSFTVPGSHATDKPTLVGLRGGEDVTVITPEQKRANSGGNDRPIVVTVNVLAPTDTEKFKANRQQLAQQVAGAVNSAMRR